MKLIFAQGNPESRFDNTRHNIGFFMVERFARKQGAQWQDKAKFFSFLTELNIEGEKVILARPTTYYNETGRAARAIADFYKLDSAADILVIHDELALPFGTIRTRSSGTDAGNNGVKSLNAALGEKYTRIRVGIWNELRERMDDADFVLSKFTTEEAGKLPEIYTEVEKQIFAFLAGTHIDETVKL